MLRKKSEMIITPNQKNFNKQQTENFAKTLMKSNNSKTFCKKLFIFPKQCRRRNTCQRTITTFRKKLCTYPKEETTTNSDEIPRKVMPTCGRHRVGICNSCAISRFQGIRQARILHAHHRLLCKQIVEDIINFPL